MPPRSGYTITSDGALTWVPPGWPHTPPHRISPPGLTPAELSARQAAHERRIATREIHPPDWPKFLIGFNRKHPPPWRCVVLDEGQRGTSTWHKTRALAIAHGEASS